jgi:CMP/dCMP kinase
MKAIILSGMPAVGKTTVAQILSKRMGLKTIGGGEILREMAKERGYNPAGEGWWDTKEGIKFLRERKEDPNFDKEADRRMINRINNGDIVVTSYTAPWISKEGIKVWLSASEEIRAERMAKRDHTNLAEAGAALRIRDRENIELYEKLYKIKFGSDKKPFHIIIDTTKMDPEQITDAILKRIKELDL